MTKKSTAILVICCLLAGSALVLAQTKKPAKKDLLAKKKQIGSKAAQVRKELRATKREKSYVMADIQKADVQLGDSRDKLEQIQSRITQAEIQRATVNVQLKEAETKLKQQEVELDSHLYDIYVDGERSPLTVLLSARSFNEISENSYVMELIAEQDKLIADDLAESRQGILDRRKEIDGLIKEIQGLRQAQIERQAELRERTNRKKDLLAELAQDQKQLQNQLDDLEKDSNEIEQMLSRYYSSGGSNTPVFRGKFIKPAGGAYGSPFGMRMHPILRYRRMHNGVDIGASYGSNIWAAGSGRVIFAGYRGGYGNCVMIDHGGGVTTVYAHCSRILVASGRSVRQGQTIAKVGSTGLSTGPHLHWEVRVNGRPVNPLGR
ncbi:MAG: peptidoglycan DD-metalloendopeptidase family protein [Fimbriimonadales bacterium]